MQRYLGIVLIVATALAAGWWLGRSTAPSRGSATAQSAHAEAGRSYADARAAASAAHLQLGVPTDAARATKPLPLPGTPLKQTFDELKARADAGDAEAASRLFEDTQKCTQFEEIGRIVPRLAKQILDTKDDSGTAKRSDMEDWALDIVQKRLDFLRANAALCADAPSRIHTSTWPSALRAAQLGNLDAADCYISAGGIGRVPPGLVEHPEWLNDYQQNALTLAEAAVERGDWIAVAELANAYEFGSSMLGQLTGHDKVLAYRYAKLRSLGVPADSPDSAMQSLFFTIKSMRNELNAEERITADAWAQNAYRDFFSTNPKNPAYANYSSCHGADL